MNMQEAYASFGGDYQGVLGRLSNDSMVNRFAIKFLDDDSFANLKQALDASDVDTAFRAAHTLKGVCQNLGFDSLYAPSSELTEVLRAGTLDGSAQLFAAVEKEYERTVSALKAVD